MPNSYDEFRQYCAAVYIFQTKMPVDFRENVISLRKDSSLRVSELGKIAVKSFRYHFKTILPAHLDRIGRKFKNITIVRS